MARSPFTLVAAVTAALPGAEVVGARTLTSDGDGRFDSAVATLADGRELVIRVTADDAAARELAEESVALRALTPGAREMLPFHVPRHVGETMVGDAPAQVTELTPGFQIDATQIPGGRGAAVSIGQAIAAIHALPASVVRGAGLTVRDADGVRAEIQQLIDRAAATGRVPARLTTRWRSAADDDDLWRFETTVTLAGLQALSFLFEDDPDDGPKVTGVLGWKGLTVSDPAGDLSWLSGAPEAAEDVYSAYVAACTRAVDGALRVRARLHAELEFARWLVHGAELRQSDIVDDAAELLESLTIGLRNDDLRVIATYTGGVDSALDVLDQTPVTTGSAVNTSMQTDAYRSEDLWPNDTDEDSLRFEEDASTTDATDAASDTEQPYNTELHGHWEEPTQDLTDQAEVSGLRGSTHDSHWNKSADGSASDAASTSPRADDPPRARDGDGASEEHPDDIDSAEEAQRAARAALQRWTNSGSE